MRPRRGHCRGCGAPVIFVQSDDEGLLVLDVHEISAGPERYAIWDDGTVHPVSSRAGVRAQQRHHCGELHVATPNVKAVD